MHFLNTEMHIVTFGITAFELLMLVFQIVYFLERKSDRKRLLYLILLIALILYNVCSGFLPDPRIPISIVVQNVIAYFVAFCTSMYFVFYYYKAFELPRLRFFATYGSIFFLFVPFVVLFVLPYLITGNLSLSRKLTVVIPFLYGISFIVATVQAFRHKFRTERINDRIKIELVVAACLALLFWLALPVIVFFGDFQALEHSVTNAGFMVMTVIYVKAMIVQSRVEYSRILDSERSRHDVVTVNAARYGLTPRETEIAVLIRKGQSYRVIGSELDISEKTVSRHVSNIFLKLGVTNKIELINRLNESERKAL